MKEKIYIGLLLPLLLSGCSQKEEQTLQEKTKVKVTQIKSSAQTKEHTYIGVIEESEGAALSFATMGTVARVLVTEGSAVRRGQTLSELDRQTLQNSYEIAHQTLAQAEDGLKRMAMLHDSSSLPEVKWVEIQTQAAQARATEKIAKKNLNDAALTAPFDGYIAKKMIDGGQNVVPGQQCFKLVKLEKVKVKFSVPEKEISQFKRGQAMTFDVAAIGSQKYSGRISEIGVEANTLSHTYEVRLELSNPGNKLKPGMVCNVESPFNSGTSTIAIPQQSVLTDGQQTYVWTVKNGKVGKRIVTSHTVNGQYVTVSNGLQDDDLVIIEGQNKVSEGMEVISVK